MELFIDRKAGFITLLNLMLSAAEDEMPPRGPMSISLAPLARRFAVSRAQIKDILNTAVADGLLAPAGPEQTYVLTPRLREGISGFFAAMFVLLADAIAEAERALRTDRDALEGAA
jgi:DNA-binding GntR family transcriptional regulator